LPAPLIASYLADGQLVAVGSEALIEEFAYYLVAPRANLSRANIAAFRAWVVRSAAEAPRMSLSS
jgi:LysR family glycine cleavage system transcriptional activator